MGTRMGARAAPRADPRTGDLHYGAGPAGVSVPGLSPARAIRLEADVLGENNRLAALNRAHFGAHGVTALNLVSSPGSGKTTLLCATIEALRQRAPGLPVAVIEGDQQTSFDADRIRASGAPAIQVNTGRGCHLDAQMVADAFGALHVHDHLDHDDHHAHHHTHRDHAGAHHHDHHHADQLLFIENVGNLVCPAMWDLGEAAKVAVLSVTEGDDKPLKYPDMFAAASLMLINKIDLLPHVNFDVARCIEFARRVNPGIEVLQVSATRGDGMDAWLDWALHAEPVVAAP
jgi:hydrogenase nickel incorporation protein HypB